MTETTSNYNGLEGVSTNPGVEQHPVLVRTENGFFNMINNRQIFPLILVILVTIMFIIILVSGSKGGKIMGIIVYLIVLILLYFKWKQ